MKIQLQRLCFVIVVLLANRLFAGEQLLLITKAHAHNDYMHTHPLFDALDNGFCSVEADIYLTNGQLLVAHELSKVKPGRTLQALYLDPLREKIKENGGHVYSNGPQFTLLIELKQDWRLEYPALRSVLKNYSDVLSSFSDGTEHTNAIIAIITGHEEQAMVAGEKIRYAGLDGQVRDLDTNPSPLLVPWISGNWKAYFRWNGAGAMPEADLRKLQKIVARAHQQGRRARFWNAPDNPNFWQAMHVAGVDLINTDNLPGVANFFRQGD
ncbi:MAG TPA: phosphatidylinositol-specific phospholipase C/glycerophosphodiester phosphodiesterase family protein [Verrucomicrobiae bacterium]|jgi:hypothetical protein|nr:phosphatidylinositol-specific phospholipase C/glycerophosphodiester phosphodiesterase family protein [Verrucomicrobiae bacterium]